MRIKPCGSMIWLIVGTITILGNPTHQYQGTILPITPSVILHGTGLLEGHRTGHSMMTKIKWGLNHKKSESDNANTTFAIFAHICTNAALCYSSHVSHIRWEYSGYMSQTYIGFGTNCSGISRSTPASQALGQSILAMVFRLNDWQQEIRPLLYLDSTKKRSKCPKNGVKTPFWYLEGLPRPFIHPNFNIGMFICSTKC